MKSKKKDLPSAVLEYKLVIVGESAVGKTCLLMKYLRDDFTSQHKVTVGVEFGTKYLKVGADSQKVKLQIWDTAGQERYRSVVKNFYRNSSAIMLVYDLTKYNNHKFDDVLNLQPAIRCFRQLQTLVPRKSTFDNLGKWLAECRENSPKYVTFALVGTHLDLSEKREVDYEYAQEWAKEQQIEIFYETSALVSINLSTIFEQIVEKVYLMALKLRSQSQFIHGELVNNITNPVDSEQGSSTNNNDTTTMNMTKSSAINSSQFIQSNGGRGDILTQFRNSNGSQSQRRTSLQNKRRRKSTGSTKSCCQ